MSSLAHELETPERIAAFRADWLPGESLSRHTSLGVGGPADLIRVHDVSFLPGLAGYLRKRGVPWRVLGGGSNLLVADEGLTDVVLQLTRGEAIAFSDNRVYIPAAVNLGTAILECAKRNLGGMEDLVGVPGTVGGALRMNAGACGAEIGNTVWAVTVFHGTTGVIETLNPQNLKFGYRHTGFSADDIILSGTFELRECPYAEILDRIKRLNQKRRASQPIQEKSAGCIFKNPPGQSAGKMIDELGLKGTRVGGAVVSELHANFIVNRFNATAADILELIELIRKRVFATYGVQLEDEVVIWKG